MLCSEPECTGGCRFLLLTDVFICCVVRAVFCRGWNRELYFYCESVWAERCRNQRYGYICKAFM